MRWYNVYDLLTIAELSSGGESPPGGKSVYVARQGVDRRPDLSKKKGYHHTGQTSLQILFALSDAAFFHHHGTIATTFTLLSSVGDTMQFFGLQDETLQANMPRIGKYWMKNGENCLMTVAWPRRTSLYQFHHTTFALKDLTHSLRNLYYYFIDFFYLKTLLSVQSVLGRAVSEEAVQLTFSHYATVTMHSAHFRPQLDALIDKLNYGDDLSCLLLLN